MYNHHLKVTFNLNSERILSPVLVQVVKAICDNLNLIPYALQAAQHCHYATALQGFSLKIVVLKCISVISILNHCMH